MFFTSSLSQSLQVRAKHYFWFLILNKDSYKIFEVGYGDVSPDRDIEKIWAILLVPIGVYAFATLIGNYIAFRVEQKAFEDSKKIMTEMNEDSLMQMDRDGSGMNVFPRIYPNNIF